MATKTPADAGSKNLEAWLKEKPARRREAPPGSWQRVRAYFHANELCDGACPWASEHPKAA